MSDQPTEIIKPFVFKRQTVTGREVHCLQSTEVDLDFVPCLLADSVGRTEDIDLARSTGLVLVPSEGGLGCEPYDPVGERFNGRYVFRQRTVFSNRDIHEQVYALLEEIAKKSDMTNRIVLPKGSGPRRM